MSETIELPQTPDNQGDDAGDGAGEIRTGPYDGAGEIRIRHIELPYAMTDNGGLSKRVDVLLAVFWVILGVMLVVVSLAKEVPTRTDDVRTVLFSALATSVSATLLAGMKLWGIRTLGSWVMFVVLAAASVFVFVLLLAYSHELYTKLKENSVILVSGLTLSALGTGLVFLRMRRP